MNFHILTLFPDMVMQGLGTSIIGRAVNNGLLSIEAVNIRDYAFNKHQSVDDYPYGGGAGMLMQAEPVYQAYEAIAEKVKKNRVSCIFLHRERLFPRLWQKNWQKKKNWCCSAGTMKESMNVFWRKL